MKSTRECTLDEVKAEFSVAAGKLNLLEEIKRGGRREGDGRAAEPRPSDRFGRGVAQDRVSAYEAQGDAPSPKPIGSLPDRQQLYKRVA